jgi:hypothetical protein
MITFVTSLSLCLSIFLQDSAVPEEKPQGWTRKIESENKVSLELVSRRYQAEGKPDLWLVGVAHIADASFYEEVGLLLDEMDIVLYESVRPTGSRPPAGLTDEERIAATMKSMDFVADVAMKSTIEAGALPEAIEDVVSNAALIDSRLSVWVEDASVDAWGRPYSIQIDGENNTIAFWCFGSDGKVGGDGSAKDLVVSRTIEFRDDALEEDKEKGIQEDLADILGLEFQLEALSYASPNWFCSDLTIGEVEEKLIEQGADPEILSMITGEAFAAKIASGMMKLIPLLDALVGGGIQETARLLIIEMLSMDGSDQMLEGIEPELAQVIIVDRNTEVLKDIAATIELVEDLSSIGVLYGAGHMKDLAERIHKLFGYSPVEDRWIISMHVNPNDSLLNESDLNRMRFMLQYQMHKASEAKKSSEKESAEGS